MIYCRTPHTSRSGFRIASWRLLVRIRATRPANDATTASWQENDCTGSTRTRIYTILCSLLLLLYLRAITTNRIPRGSLWPYNTIWCTMSTGGKKTNPFRKYNARDPFCPRGTRGFIAIMYVLTFYYALVRGKFRYFVARYTVCRHDLMADGERRGAQSSSSPVPHCSSTSPPAQLFHAPPFIITVCTKLWSLLLPYYCCRRYKLCNDNNNNNIISSRVCLEKLPAVVHRTVLLYRWVGGGQSEFVGGRR